MKRKWPFPGDQPLIRARKVALAYRTLLQQREEAEQQIRDVLEKLDRRLISYSDPASVGLLDKALATLNDCRTEALDQRFTEWGETWHCDQPEHYEETDYVKAATAAKILAVSHKTISTLRINGRLTGHWDPDMGTAGGYWYLVKDIHDLSRKMRGRNWRGKGSTDTLNDSGRSDTE